MLYAESISDAVSLFLTLYSERRPHAAFVAVVLTNGDSNSAMKTLDEASQGRRVGITFVTVAAEPWLDRYVLSAIASFPHQYNTIVAANYSSLPTAFYDRYLADTICNSQFTIRYDSVYLMCSKKLTDSQLSLPHGINKKLKCETKNKIIQSCYHEAVQ